MPRLRRGLEQFQFLLGHASIQTTERYLGSRQNLKEVGDGPTGHNQRMKMGEAGDGRERTPHWAFEPVRKFASGRVGA
jgi:integrase